MDNKEKNRKKKIKVILGICISVFLFLGGGLLAYIHKVDTDTLGRKITIYGLDVSGQNVEKAGQTIRKAFQDKKVVFREDGSQVYQLKHSGNALFFEAACLWDKGLNFCILASSDP